jgi:hypothetical protein
MPKYRVGLCYSGYVWRTVEAANEDAAYAEALRLADTGAGDVTVSDWERWSDADEMAETWSVEGGEHEAVV